MSVKKYKLKNVKDKKASEHFLYREFSCPGTDTLKLDNNLPLYLEALFYKLKAEKAIITSGYRTPEYSVSIGGTRTDKHTKGMAADVIFYNRAGTVISPAVVCCAAEDLGFIGGVAKIGDTATHIDTRPVSEKYWGDESTGSFNSIWYQRPGCKSFYEWFDMDKPKEVLVTYRAKRGVIYRLSPFKLYGNKAGRLKKGTMVKVVKGGRVKYGGTVFYKLKTGGEYHWVNKEYLVR